MRSVLVTGCNRGIGLGLIRHLAKRMNPPKHVIGTCRDLQKAKELHEIADRNKNVHILKLDMRDCDRFPEFAKQVENIVAEDGLNVLFNNAGISSKFTRIQLVKYEQLMEAFRVNTIGPIMLTKVLLPLLRQAATQNPDQGLGADRALVVNMTSVLGSIALNADGGFYPYRCSKVALNMATKSMSLDLRSDGILVTGIHPGWVKTDMGGAKAPLDVETCVAGILEVVESANETHGGGYPATAMDFIIGGLAAMGASVFSNPFDVIKTRMQLQGELHARGQHAVHYKNTFHAAYVVAKNEGLRGLQKGLGTALIMHSVRNSVRLGSYQWLQNNGFICDSGGKTILWRSLVASSFSGAAGAFCGSPFFLIKTQLQSQAALSIAVGHQHGHKGLLNAIKSIYEKHGITGLWRGGNATMLRAVFGSSAQLTSFAKAKDFFKEYEVFRNSTVLTAFAASIVGGVFQAVCMTPFDLVSTRLYNQGTDAQGKGLLYKGIVDCFIKTYRSEGVRGIYKGLGPNYMRLAPHGAFCLVFWDILKDLQEKYIK